MYDKKIILYCKKNQKDSDDVGFESPILAFFDKASENGRITNFARTFE